MAPSPAGPLVFLFDWLTHTIRGVLFFFFRIKVSIPEDMVSSIDNVRGLTLAISSSAFIGSSFIIKKIGLKKAGDHSGVRAGSGGFSYLYEPLWWLGMITMILGEVANFAAYAFAPAVLVTPLGALSIIFSAVLAHFVLKEKLHMFGVVGCILCVVGSVGIVLHAPKEREIDSMSEIWHLATEPGFIAYSCVAVVGVLFLIFWVVERSGHRKMLVYIAICSTMGSLTVISVKAVAIALKLSFSGSNQFIYIQTWFFIVVVIICCLVQLNYLNKALDSYNTAVVSPVYYVMFTILTIFANMIMYKDSFSRNATQVATQLCGFVTIVAGTFLLHKTRDMGNEPPPSQSDEICLDGDSERPSHP
uniref:Probable magnesium transporter n=1 Tax=Leersia perrieri TaxID=77586 RepID=A0A0D9VG61_9ORYZ